MIEKKYVCAKCKQRFVLRLLEDGESPPAGMHRAAPKCPDPSCKSEAVFDADELSS